MNRLIKFRAWDKNKKVFIPTDTWAVCTLENNPKAFAVMIEDWEDYCVGEYMYDYAQEIMQFTGLHDKNGKEIYEGDWCTAKFRTKDGIEVIQGEIKMDEFMWCIDCTGCVGDDIFSINRPHDFEIIGNIYENPELLK